MIKSIIVDDEENILEEIKDIIEGFNEIEVVDTDTNPMNALEKIKQKEVQLVFLDIEMPGIDGISLAKKIAIEKPNVEIVFITAYNQYALDAFEVNAIDYVLKPIREERMEKTLKKVLKVIKQEEINTKKDILKIKSFKKLEVFIGDQPIKWRTLKDGELFAYFIENVAVPLHKEKIIEELWDETDLKNALIYLQSSIYRIRKILAKAGYENSITYANNCYTMKYIDVDSDIWSYRRLLNKDYNISDNNIEMFEKLEKLYTGDYLEEDGYVWSINLAEALKHRYLELIKNIGKYYTEKGNFVKAIKYLEKIIKIDPLNSEGIKLLFNAYYNNGELHNLKKQFFYLKSLVVEEYGIELSKDVVNYYKSLI